LFGIYYLEQAVAVFSKGGFKQLLKKFTSNTTSSVVTGIISTLIVQSSNLISVLVLAFV
jgi:Na+/phosphate symporter